MDTPHDTLHHSYVIVTGSSHVTARVISGVAVSLAVLPATSVWAE